MGQSKQSGSDAEKAQKNFFELLKKFDTAMLVTHSTKSAGPLHGRPMEVAETSEDGSIWFITGQDTPKIDEIEKDSELVALFQESRQYLSVSGRAELHKDRARIHKVWKESYRVWFSGGKDDPNIVLIRLNPTSAEYWDNTGPKGLTFILKAAAAYVTGSEIKGSGDVDHHAKVSL